jgi:hypothetical protein
VGIENELEGMPAVASHPWGHDRPFQNQNKTKYVKGKSLSLCKLSSLPK